MTWRDKFRPSPISLTIAAAVWLLVLSAGFWMMTKYELTPGSATAESPRAWPDGLALTRSERTSTLVMVAHPRCPCTRASITELAELIADLPKNAAKVSIVFYTPESPDAAWTTTANWRDAEAIPGAEIVRDPGGVIAKRLGAETSGEVFVFGLNGELVFEGGITAARGHVGPSTGRSSVAGWLRGHQSTIDHTPVFGCSLFAPDACEPPADDTLDPQERAVVQEQP